MSSNKKLSNYVSEIDCFLQNFDKKHPGLSQSQKKEIARAQRVTRLRDDASCIEKPSKLWDQF